ncbi:winged helix-turn-helix domain-containing protein [Streptomyces avermitilis]
MPKPSHPRWPTPPDRETRNHKPPKRLFVRSSYACTAGRPGDAGRSAGSAVAGAGVAVEAEPGKVRAAGAELAQGPSAHGWEGQRWTLARIKTVIVRRFHLTCTVQGVRKLLVRNDTAVPQPLPPRPLPPPHAPLGAGRDRGRGAGMSVLADELGPCRGYSMSS